VQIRHNGAASCVRHWNPPPDSWHVPPRLFLIVSTFRPSGAAQVTCLIVTGVAVVFWTSTRQYPLPRERRVMTASAEACCSRAAVAKGAARARIAVARMKIRAVIWVSFLMVIAVAIAVVLNGDEPPSTL